MRHGPALCLMALVSFVACGRGGNLTNPDREISGKVEVRSGRDGLPVAAQISGRGSALSVSAPGFLKLDTIDRHRPLYLWPNDDQVTLGDTLSFVYNGEANVLNRLGDSTTVVSVIPSGTILTDPAAIAALQEGVDVLNRSLAAAGITLRYDVSGPGQVQVNVNVDPTDPLFSGVITAAAGTYNTRTGAGVITKSRIVFLNLTYARIPVAHLHELAHVFGLYHSLHDGPMSSGPQVYNYRDFTDLDRLYMRLFRTRQPGTRISAATATENDRGAVSASRMQESTGVIVCW